MRIGIFDPYLDTLGGGEKYMLTAASRLSTSHQVDLFWDKDLLEEASKKFNIDLGKVKVKKNIFDKSVNFTKRLIESSKYDAIFYLSDGSIPIVACKLYIHFQFPVEWVNTGSLITKQKIKRVEAFICNSQFTKEYIDKKFNVKSIVLYPPTYLKKESKDINYKKKKNYILNVGRLSKVGSGDFFKKQDFLIKAFNKLSKENTNNYELNLAVSFSEQNKHLLEDLKKLVGNNNLINIYENLNFEKLNSLYTESKIYWHASGFGEDLNNHPEKAEHFGITTVEAMANGVVPVVINEGGQKEIVDNKKDGFLWNSEEELINLTLSLIKDDTLLEKLSKQAVVNSEKFSTEIFYQNLDKVFNNE
jgi:glycosyltransferase involved in cell wall biosynthesis